MLNLFSARGSKNFVKTMKRKFIDLTDKKHVINLDEDNIEQVQKPKSLDFGRTQLKIPKVLESYSFKRTDGIPPQKEKPFENPKWIQNLVLKDYQVEGVKMMLDIEKNFKSGILADDMGLGKTIQSLWIICNDNPFSHTLVLCPLSVLDHWKKKILQFSTLQPVTYYGTNRKGIFYNFSKNIAGKPKIMLSTYDTLVSDFKNGANSIFEFQWDRIILDEGHNIRNTKTKSYKMASYLKAKHRWVLSGTPVLNRMNDFLVLMVWLGLYTTEKANSYKRNLTRNTLQEIREFSKKIMIRREKTDSRIQHQLPKKSEKVYKLDWRDATEKAQYEQLFAANRKEAAEMVDDGAMMFHLLKLISMLRRFCDHPTLTNHPKLNYDQWIEKPNSKITALFQMLMYNLKQDKEKGVSRKYVIFSQWTSMLDQIQYFIERIGLSFGRYDGQMTQNERSRQLSRFEKGNIPIFLVSTLAGGVGLDLSVANIAFIMDPWWNKGIESQAADRLHRFGQEKDVEIIHFIMKESIEEDIYNLQKKKQTHVDGLLKGGKLKADFQLEDIKLLFHFKKNELY